MPVPSHPTVALPESRQLDVLARLLERRGVSVQRCPLVAIQDAPDQTSIAAWIDRFIAGPPDVFIVFTGEGIGRLVAAADRSGRREPFVAALGRAPMLTRGPKPVRALRELGLAPTWQTSRPTTNGVLAVLDELPLEGRRVCVQLYGGERNSALEAYLERRHAEADDVAPYIYTSAAADEAVSALIEQLVSGAVDAIAFTSKSQVTRLFDVAVATGCEAELKQALLRIKVAAVGPVVSRALDACGVRVDVMPDKDFFMKPLVTRLVEALKTD